jgi:hypothetical protein
MKKRIVLVLASFTWICAAMGQSDLWPIGMWVSKERKKSLEIRIFQAADQLLYGRVISEDGRPTKDTGLFIKKLRAGSKVGQYNGLLTPPGSWFDLELTMYSIDANKAELIAGRAGMVKRIKLIRKG